jgi:hypothetical protein
MAAETVSLSTTTKEARPHGGRRLGRAATAVGLALLAAACSSGKGGTEGTAAASAPPSATASPTTGPSVGHSGDVIPPSSAATTGTKPTAEVCQPAAGGKREVSRRYTNPDGSRHLSSSLVATSVTLAGSKCHDTITIGYTGTVNKSDLPGILAGPAKPPFKNNADKTVEVAGAKFISVAIGANLDPGATRFDAASLGIITEGATTDAFEGYGTVVFGEDRAHQLTLTEQPGGTPQCPAPATFCQVVTVQRVP